MQQDMQYVYTLYKEGNFSKAAAKLFISQPALSMAIQKTEASLGMPLFDRSTRPMRLTPAGEIYIAAIRKTRYLEQDLSQQIEDIKSLKTGTVSIGGTNYINSYILPDILAGFNQEYPELKISLKEGSAYQMESMLKERTIDLSISCDPGIIVNFKGFQLFTDHLLVAVPKQIPIPEEILGCTLSAADIINKKHLAPEYPAVSVSSFKNIDFILLEEGNNLYDRSMKIFENAGFSPSVKIQLSQLVTAHHLAESGYAATFISDRLIKHEDSNLNYFKLEDKESLRTFYILSHPDRYISNAVSAFIDYIQDYFEVKL